jgi:hypothetical protein
MWMGRWGERSHLPIGSSRLEPRAQPIRANARRISATKEAACRTRPEGLEPFLNLIATSQSAAFGGGKGARSSTIQDPTGQTHMPDD